MYSLRTTLCTMALVAFVSLPAVADDQPFSAPDQNQAVASDQSPLQVQQQGNVSFVTGGVGEEERTALEAAKPNYNLRIISADAVGAYSGDTHLVITDKQHQEVLNTEGGPLFYVNLPPGRYLVEGTTEAQVKRQYVNVSARQPARVQFVWKADPGEETASNN